MHSTLKDPMTSTTMSLYLHQNYGTILTVLDVLDKLQLLETTHAVLV